MKGGKTKRSKEVGEQNAVEVGQPDVTGCNRTAAYTPVIILRAVDRRRRFIGGASDVRYMSRLALPAEKRAGADEGDQE